MTITHEHVCEGTWKARSHARFWEPGVEEWAREKLYLPDNAHITAAMYDRLRIGAFSEVDGPIPGNQLVTAGLAALTSQLRNGTKDWAVSAAGSGFTGLAVGTGTAADVVGNTDLSGGSKSYRVCDDGYNTVANGVITFFVTFASGEANFSWDEYSALVPSGSASALSGSAVTSKPANYIILNRKSPAGLGIKAGGAPASLQLTITIT